MRYLFGFLCVCALGAVPLVGCGETAAGCEGAIDGTACNDGACLDGVCAALTTVSGAVFLLEFLDPADQPAGGATVSLLGTSLSTTTDEFGEFSFDVFPGDWFFRTSKEDTWSLFELVTVPTEGQPDLGLNVLSDALVAQWEQDLRAQDSMAKIDDTKGIVAVIFSQTSGLGGETATLSEPHDGSFVEAGGIAVESDKLPPGAGPDQDLFFYGVDLTEELTVTPMEVEGVNTCSLQEPETVYPVMAKSVTLVGAVCTAVP